MSLLSIVTRLTLLLALSGSLSSQAQAQAPVQGAGATFPSKVYASWAQAYAQAGGARIEYRAVGSGKGIAAISERQVDFGGTDSPLPPEQLARRGLVQLPMLVGGVVPVINLPGKPALRLTGELLAELMLGRVERWNDARIAALNPGLVLPALPVLRIVRADKSGTSEGFSAYLSLASADFGAAVGAGQLPAWPGAVQRADGNDGVIKLLAGQPGAISYTSHDRVLRDRLNAVQLKNPAGRFVAPSEAGFRAAILESEMHRKGDDQATLLNRPGADSWPITLTSFVLLEARPADIARSGAAMRFLYWCLLKGDDLTRGSGFAALPVSVQSRLAARFAQIKGRDGSLPDYLSF